MRGAVPRSFLFTFVTSSWLVPFAIAHRFLAFIPALVRGKGASARPVPISGKGAGSKGLDQWLGEPDADLETARRWTAKAQSIWRSLKTVRSREDVVDWLNYNGKLEAQPIKATRVVYTRSRTLYASVLSPTASTALGLPLQSVVVKTREGERIRGIDQFKTQGVMVDNLLHWIEVSDPVEAYWLSGILNARVFIDRVLARAGGKEKGSQFVPGIYNIPVDLLNEYGLQFDPDDKTHKDIASLAANLEREMGAVIRTYIQDEKGVDANALDDTEVSPEVPVTISSALRRRLATGSAANLKKLEESVNRLMPR